MGFGEDGDETEHNAPPGCAVIAPCAGRGPSAPATIDQSLETGTPENRTPSATPLGPVCPSTLSACCCGGAVAVACRGAVRPAAGRRRRGPSIAGGRCMMSTATTTAAAKLHRVGRLHLPAPVNVTTKGRGGARAFARVDRSIEMEVGLESSTSAPAGGALLVVAKTRVDRVSCSMLDAAAAVRGAAAPRSSRVGVH